MHTKFNLSSSFQLKVSLIHPNLQLSQYLQTIYVLLRNFHGQNIFKIFKEIFMQRLKVLIVNLFAFNYRNSYADPTRLKSGSLQPKNLLPKI